MPRTRRHCLETLAGALLLLPAMGLSLAGGEPLLRGAFTHVGGTRVRFSLRNAGAQTVQVLNWATPFEGWLAPWAALWHEGRPLVYGGATVKRGEPDAEEYLRLAPGRQRQTTVDLAEVFDLSAPGRYELRPAITLHDVVPGAGRVPRPRSAHQPLVLDCAPLAFERGR